MKISIIDKIKGKPSNALRYMVQGLLEQSKRKRFVIEMSTFGRQGYVDNTTICMGCAATCTIQKIANKNIPLKKIDATHARAASLRLDVIEVIDFESAIDGARCGNLFELFRFCKRGKVHRTQYDNKFYLDNEDWKNDIPKVRKLIKKLKSKGL